MSLSQKISPKKREEKPKKGEEPDYGQIMKIDAWNIRGFLYPFKQNGVKEMIKQQYRMYLVF